MSVGGTAQSLDAPVRVPVSDVEQEVLGTANELIQSAEVEAVTTIIQGATVASFAAYLEVATYGGPSLMSLPTAVMALAAFDERDF